MTTPVPALTAVLDELDELRAKATAGEWGAGLPGARPDGMTNLDAMTRSAEYRTYAAVGSTREPADAALIVAAVNHLPELTAEVRRGRALREAVEKLIAFYDRHEYSTLNVDDIRAALEAS